MSLITPTLSIFTVAPRNFIKDASFQLIDPSSNNTNPAAVFTFASSNRNVADISGRTVIIINSGQTTITATQAATTGYTTGQITAIFTVNVAAPSIGKFTITPTLTEFQNGSFDLQDPSSNSSGSFRFESLTTDIVTISNRTAIINRVGRAQIKATQVAAGNYTSGFVIATFDVLTSIVIPGTQNRIDLSWNIPTENGATIKNYFFYKEERRATISPAPTVSTMIESTVATNPSYYSYVLPVPYSTQILSATVGAPTGIDVNAANTSFNITTLPIYSNNNFFDMGYYGEIEVNWVYHNDRPIAQLASGVVASTTMTLSIYKEASAQAGDKRIDLILNASRTYDSAINCYGPMPQNNNKTMTDIFTITFPGSTSAMRELKYLKQTDIISGRVTISNNTYFPADAPNTPKEYSIIIKSIRIAPFRFPITRDFTSLGFGLGTVNGFSVSTFNALLLSPSSSDVSGVLYHMPKMTRPLTDYNKASCTFSWNYAANLSKLTTDISYLPVSGGLITNLNIQFNMRIRGYSRPYAKTSSLILDASYNSTSVPFFLTNVSNTQYNTRQLFDVSFNADASYNQIFSDLSSNTSSYTVDIPDVTGFSPYTNGIDYSHSQFVFLFQMTILDPSYNAYFRTMNTEANSFQVKMLSQTFTPYQDYRFAGPDPTLASSSALTSSTNTLYNIVDYYTPIKPFYSFFDLSNGVFYSYRISSHNIVGTTAFSELLTRRCGSIPNTIVNRVNSLNAATLTVESERTSNRVNIYWEKPSFTGYEIQYFFIQMAIDVSGRWVNSLEYTSDISTNLITFNMFYDTIVNVTDQTKSEYDETISVYTYKNLASQQNFNTSLGLNTPDTGPLLNGYKYYFRLASVNELGRSEYSTVLSGIPFARPVNSPIKFIGDQTIGNQMVILTWKIPQDDAGSPILNYIIDYQEVNTTQSGTKIYTNKTRYIQDAIENGFYQQANRGYPFDDFRKVYADGKKYSTLTTTEQNNLLTLRNEISKYIIHPRPITLNDADKFLESSTDLSKNIVLSNTNRTFTYKSNLLTQNVFDISNIQLKWYYTPDMAGGGEVWTNDVSLSFQLSIRGHLEHNSDSTRDISGIFDISGTYVVDLSKMSSPTSNYNYISYLTGNVIQDGTNILNIPMKYVNFQTLSPPSLYRIDHNNGKGYYLKMDYTISNISRSDYRFMFYSGKIVINGVAPVRTFSGLNTEFTVTLKSNIYSPFVNGKTYLFTITPFNINDFFPDPSIQEDNYGNGISQIARTMGTEFSDPITDMSYSLISTSQGGKVLLQWKYSSKPRYYINIQIPPEYSKEDVFPQEYPLLLQPDGTTRSILTPNLDPSNGIVSYMIPSNLQSDIDASNANAQKYLKAGRGYYISVSPLQSFIDNQGNAVYIPAPSRNMFADNTYIIPFRVPLRPLELWAQGYNSSVMLKWKLPDLNNDPNFYNTDIINTYYRYKYFTLERRDISVSVPVWVDVSNDIFIPTPDNGGVAGYQAQYSISGIANEQPQQFRIRTVIMNEYNGQRAESDYTYMSIINNIPVLENPGNSVYPSLYPYKPSVPLLRFADRSATATGAYNGLTCIFDYPTYNGNADYYECDIYYTPNFGAVWYGIFDVNNGIADISYNISVNGGLFTTNGKLRTTSAAIGSNQHIMIVCRNTILSYGIKIRMYPRINGMDGVYPYGNNLYSEFSNVDYIDI